MEQVHSLDPNENQAATTTANDHHSNVDTSRPFRSVKEAVAILGERFSVGETYSPRPFSFPKKELPFYSPSLKLERESSWEYLSPSSRNSSYSHDTTLTVKKLEAELQETKAELQLLKERESETEVALASLNAELHKNMSKLALAEAAAAAAATAKAVASSGSMSVRDHGDMDRGVTTREEEKKKGDLAQVMSVGEKESLFVGRKKERKGMKKKPILPLLGDLFSRKKGSSTNVHNPLYASSPPHWN